MDRTAAIDAPTTSGGSGGTLRVPADALVLVAGLAALWGTSRYTYTLFHSLAELVSIAIAAAVFLIAWNVRPLLESSYLLFLGVGYLFVALVDTMHTLAYKGMGVFGGGGADLPTQLWIAGRYLQAAVLVLAPFAIGRTARPRLWLVAFAVATAGLLAVVFLGGFPHCYVEGTGLTEFKKASEYAVSALFLVSIGLLLRRRAAFDPVVLALLVGSLAFAIGTELMFTEYGSVYANANLAGHLLKIVAFYLVYKAIIETGLRQPYRLLFRELATREQALAARGTELAAVNAELETFAYSASHDLRAPLRAIDGYARMLEEDCSEELDERGRGYVERIDTAAKRMEQLIDDLLRLSRLMLGEVRSGPVDLAEVARSVEAELAEQEPERHVEFVCAATAPVEGDPGLLRVLLENLIGNAWKFTGTRPTARIEFGVERRNGETLYFVRDDGVGFDPRRAGRLFTPFQRLHRADEFPGNGIGLATVRRIVARHGGVVTAEGEPGRGATFSFTLGGTNGGG